MSTEKAVPINDNNICKLILFPKQKPSKTAVVKVDIKREMVSPLPISRYSRKITVFTCPECKADFSNKDRLNQHMEGHSSSASNVQSASPKAIIDAPRESARMETNTDFNRPSPLLQMSPIPNQPVSTSSIPVLSESIMALIGPPFPVSRASPPPTGNCNDVLPPLAEVVLNDAPRSSTRKRGRKKVHPITERKTTLMCPICKEVRPSKGALQNHVEMHHGKRPFMCPTCRWSYETEMKLIEHFTIRHSRGEPFFECEDCEKSYKRAAGLENHRRLKH